MNKKNYNEDLNILNNYFKDLNSRKTKYLTFEDEVALAIRIEAGDEKAIQELVQPNLKFVVSIAHKYKNKGVLLSDLISEGNYGLIKAAKRFDHTKGYRFISYAVFWIKQAMLQSLNDNVRTIRLPVNILNKIYQLKRELDDFDMDTQNLSEEDFQYLNKFPQCTSYNRIINEDGSELLDIISIDDDIKTFDDLTSEDDEVRGDINDILSILDNRERQIIISYYGLFDTDEDSMTLEAIGDIYGLTKERVRQIKGRAIKKLKANIPSILKLSS